MFLVSQNIEAYDVELPKNTVFRINLAWCNSLEELKTKLSKNKGSNFFVDLPIGRIKPPNNRYSLDDMLPIINENKNIVFFAVSNVESKDDLRPFLEKLPERVNIVPKIESPTAVKNIDGICSVLKSERKIIMLDHDDLFSSIIRNKEDSSMFQEYIKELIDYCKKNKISLLRTVGVVFSDDEMRTTQYVK